MSDRVRWAVIGGLVFLAIFSEVRSADLEARGFSFLARGLLFNLEPGPNPRPYFPDKGPYDVRLGHARLPTFFGRLRASGYLIDSQTRLSPALQHMAGSGLFPVYREKTQAGLRVVDWDGQLLYSVRHPGRIYERFEMIPPLVVTTLLFEHRKALDELSDSYLRIMAQAGIIDGGLRDAALGQGFDVQTRRPRAAVDFSERKGPNLVRARLTTLLGVPALYDLDRLDLTVQSTLDGPSQEAVTRVLRSLRDPATVDALGLRGFHLLERGDPALMIYSFTLYERGPGVNWLRVHTDNFDQPLDINGGARLDLGSTAKLRTLITYLEVMATLHDRYAGLTPKQLRLMNIHPRDRLTAWAVESRRRTGPSYWHRSARRALRPRYRGEPEGGVT